MKTSKVIELLDKLTALQAPEYTGDALDGYRLGYYKYWLSYIISGDEHQQEILMKLIKDKGGI